MSRKIRIRAGSVELLAELNGTETASAILAALPIEGSARLWGDEIYFPIPVAQGLEQTAAEIVEIGDLGYWPTGKAFCLFFGPTPASRGREIRPASAVNLVGRVQGDARLLKAVENGDVVRLERDG